MFCSNCIISPKAYIKIELIILTTTGKTYNSSTSILNKTKLANTPTITKIIEKNFIKLDSDAKEVHYIDLYLETKVVEDKSALKSYMLNKTEEDAYVIIQNVISKYNGYAPRYVLEGALLYGELELSPKRTYNITVSLENKNLLKKVKRADGEYYTI